MPHQVYDLDHLIYRPVKDVGCGWVQGSVKYAWQQIWVSHQYTLQVAHLLWMRPVTSSFHTSACLSLVDAQPSWCVHCHYTKLGDSPT